jgi:hypothetical protein
MFNSSRILSESLLEISTSVECTQYFLACIDILSMYRQTITFTDECKELEVLDKGLSIRRASEKFNVPKSTVADIKKNKEK